MLTRLGIESRATTAYHPQANGLIERAHSTLKNALRCMSVRMADWEFALPTALLAMRTAINERGVSPSLVVFFQPRTYTEECHTRFVEQLQEDGDLIRQYILETDDTLKGNEGDRVPVQFPYENVYLREEVKKSALGSKFTGPYPVVRHKFPVIYIVKNGKEQAINVDRVRPAYRLQDLQPEMMVQQQPARPLPYRVLSEMRNVGFVPSRPPLQLPRIFHSGEWENHTFRLIPE